MANEKQREGNEGVEISVVIPLYDERDNIRPLYGKLSKVLDSLGRGYEIIWVDDGSGDGSFGVLEEIHRENKANKIISFRKNFGQTAALSAGFDTAGGDIVVTMDADLQNEPEDIKNLLAKMDEGYDLVSGWRHERKESFLSRRLPSYAANWLISHVSKVKLHDYGCTLKAYRKEVVKALRLYGEMHRFIPALANIRGITFAEIKVGHSPRRKGKSKYGISRTVRVLLDLFTVKFLLSFSTRPMQIFGFLGMVSFSLGAVIGMYLTGIRIFTEQGIGGRPLLLLAVLLIIIGLQFVSLGLLGEMIVRANHESQQRPIYAVKKILR